MSFENSLEQSYGADVGHAAFSTEGYQHISGSPTNPFNYISAHLF